MKIRGKILEIIRPDEELDDNTLGALYHDLMNPIQKQQEFDNTFRMYNTTIHTEHIGSIGESELIMEDDSVVYHIMIQGNFVFFAPDDKEILKSFI